MADSFFGFSSEMPAYEDEELAELDPSLSNLQRNRNIDLVNEDTFGTGALEDDWEEAHRKLAGVNLEDTPVTWKGVLHESTPKHNQYGEKHRQRTGVIKDDDDDEANLEEEEEILEQTLAKLVDEDESEPRKSYASSGYKDIPRVSTIASWNGSSPLSSPTSSSSLHELISPSSNIWASPNQVHVDKENAIKGSSNVPITPAYTPSNDRKKTPRRPYSPAFEDDAILKAVPKPETLMPPSSFTRKPPINVIRLEDLEKEFTNDSSTPREPPETPQQTGRRPHIGKLPPGIPHPGMISPHGYQPMPQTPQGPGLRPFPMPPQMFQGRTMPGKHPLAAGSPGLGYMHTPPPPFPRPPLPMMHSDPGHLMHRGSFMNFPMTPPRPRYSTPQPYQHPQYRNHPDNRNNYYDNRNNYHDNRSNYHDNRSNYLQQRRGYGHDLDRNMQQYQHTDLENKIHEILTRDENETSMDPYAGLMTRREKEWLIKIQLLQLTSSTPDLDDFYFQTYTRRKQAKERAKQGEGVETQKRGGTTAQMALPQFEREERNYKPLDFRGTLGKVSATSISHPRQMVDLQHVNKSPEQDKQSSSSAKDSRRRRQILSVIEKAYDYLLQLDDLEKKIINVSAEERNVLLEAKQSTVVKLFNLLRLNVRAETSGRCDEEFFVQLLSVRKGKVLISRMLPALKQPQAEAILLSLTHNIIPIIKRDSQDDVLPLVISPVSRVVELGSSAVVFHSLRHVVYGDRETSPGQTSILSVVLASQKQEISLIRRNKGTTKGTTKDTTGTRWSRIHGWISLDVEDHQFGVNLLNSLLKKSSSLSSSISDNKGELQQSWETLVGQVAKEFNDTPVKSLAKHLSAVTPLVNLLSTYTNPYVAASLQEHYRMVVWTREGVKS